MACYINHNKKRCKAITTKGSRCKYRSVIGDLCLQHFRMQEGNQDGRKMGIRKPEPKNSSMEVESWIKKDKKKKKLVQKKLL